MTPYLLLAPRHRLRTLSAAGTGVATGLFGTAVPIIGASVGVTLSIVGKGGAVVDGLIDGSFALIAKQIATR